MCKCRRKKCWVTIIALQVDLHNTPLVKNVAIVKRGENYFSIFQSSLLISINSSANAAVLSLKWPKFKVSQFCSLMSGKGSCGRVSIRLRPTWPRFPFWTSYVGYVSWFTYQLRGGFSVYALLLCVCWGCLGLAFRICKTFCCQGAKGLKLTLHFLTCFIVPNSRLRVYRIQTRTTR